MHLLERSFVVLPGIGPLTERRLWKEGISSFSSFLSIPRVRGISPERKRLLDRAALTAIEACRRRDERFFAARLPHREVWRMLPDFFCDAAFLDIETTGLSRSCAITVVGVHRPGRRFGALVRGRNLSAAPITEALEGAKLLVTFNGASFDVPHIRNSFPSARLPPAHLDLRPAARRVGLVGGLKAIEGRLGLVRDLEMRVLAGHDAVRLWNAYARSGSQNALRLLLRYNEADCVNLEPVASAVAGRLLEQTPLPAARGRIQIPLPAS